MSKFIISSSIALCGVTAFAFEYGQVHMTCVQARATANRTGYITVDGPGGVVDIALTGLEGVQVPFGAHVVVQATDNQRCLAGYIADDTSHGR